MWSTSFGRKAQLFNFRIAREISSSKHSHMRELRIQHEGRPYRLLYAFDPKRAAVLLIGGDKTGADRWYEIFVPLADRLYDEHLADVEKEDHG